MVDEFRNKFLLHLGIALASVGLLAVIALLFGAVIQRRVDGTIGLRNQFFNLSNNLQSLVLLRGESQQSGEYEKKFAAALPDRSQIFNFPRVMATLARQYNLTFTTSLTGEKVSTQIEPGAVVFTMSLNGDWTAIMNFLDALDDSEYIIELSSFNLTHQEGSKFKAQIDGSVFTR
ncbi:MAG: hypothetical protein HY456_03255 [Parcubacteria group bacterium]|nr:hypothetical protein [Parcubacteria group bacterium]